MIEEPDQLYCSTCNVWHPAAEFYKTRTTRGYSYSCKKEMRRTWAVRYGKQKKSKYDYLEGCWFCDKCQNEMPRSAWYINDEGHVIGGMCRRCYCEKEREKYRKARESRPGIWLNNIKENCHAPS